MIIREPRLRSKPASGLQGLGQSFIAVIGEIGKASMICAGASRTCATR